MIDPGGRGADAAAEATVNAVETAAPLPVVDGRELSRDRRRLLRPGDVVEDADGRRHRLPRWFYEVASWEVARATSLAPFVGAYELIAVDVREAPPLRAFPRYLPLAVTHLAAHLSVLRQAVGTFVHVAANGGYRSPVHGVNEPASVHSWGTAANLYRIGDDFLDSPDAIERYTEVVRRVLPAVWCRPWGRGPGGTIDHLHLDLGRVVVRPRGRGEDGDDG